jgi:hypothetical protein
MVDKVEHVRQPPVTVRIVNNTDEIRYLPGNQPVSAFYSNDLVGYEPVRIDPPYCMLSCDTAAGQEGCCIACEQALVALAVLPGEYVDHLWNGELFLIDYTLCDGCGCHYPVDPNAG